MATSIPRPEGTINYFDGTPLAEVDGDPATYLKDVPVRSTERFKYPCLIHLKGQDDIGFFDKDGNRRNGGTKLRNVAQQAQYLIMGVNGTFLLKDEALSIASQRAKLSGRQVPVVEDIVGDKGKVLRSTVLMP